MSGVAFSCRSVGFPCEWGLHASTADEVLQRFADHGKCAHNLSEVPPDLAARVRAAVRAT